MIVMMTMTMTTMMMMMMTTTMMMMIMIKEGEWVQGEGLPLQRPGHRALQVMVEAGNNYCNHC